MWWWIILAALYICLWLYQRWNAPTVSWTRLPTLAPPRADLAPCQMSDDCSRNQACFQQKCYPKQNGGPSECQHGQWVLESWGKQREFVTCQCQYPHLWTQRYPGGSCDVALACVPHGILQGLDRCLCHDGYKPVFYGTVPGCQKLTPFERVLQHPIPGPEDIEAAQVGRGSPLPYVRKPCTFDAVSGLALEKNRFDPQLGCLCNPKYGNVGVHFDHPDYIGQVSGYNGCINVFQEERFRHDVQLFTYFWYPNQPPISFIQYGYTDSFFHQPATGIQIEETWPHTAFQYILRHEPFQVEIQWQATTWTAKPQRQVRPNHTIDCQDYDHLIEYAPNSVNYFNVLYQYPVCQFSFNDRTVPALYRGQFVSNPLHITLDSSVDMPRYHGLVLSLDSTGQWLVRWATSLAVDELRLAHERAPHVPEVGQDILDQIQTHMDYFKRDFGQYGQS